MSVRYRNFIVELKKTKKKEMEQRAFKLTNRAILFADNCLVSGADKRKKGTFKFC